VSTEYLDGTGAFSTPAGGGASGGTSTLVGWHGWSANPKSVTSPTGYGFVPADNVNNAGVLSVNLPAAGVPLSWKLTTTATASSWHEFGDTDAVGITLGTLGQFQSQAALGQTSACRMWIGLAADGGTGSIFESDAPSGEPMAMFRFSTAASDTNFQCVTGSGSGAPTVTDSGVAADTAFHVFRITYNSTTPSVKFYIDGALVATVTLTLPSATFKMSSFIHIDNVGAANDKYALVSYITWTNNPDPGASATLASLTDVLITSPSNGQVLTYNGGASKWENSAPPGGVPSGTPVINMGNQAPVALGPLGATYSLFLKISGRSLNCLPSSWKVRIQRGSGSHFSACVILRTLADSATVVDSTAVTFGGSATPTLSAGQNLSDAIALALDTTHDYWVCAYNDTGDSSFWGLKPAVQDNSSTIGVVGGYISGDQTGVSTIPIGSINSGFGCPWDAALAA